MLKLALLAPTDRSLYSRLLAALISREPSLSLDLIIARKMFSPKRIRGELRRDGPRLLRKVSRKLVIGEEQERNDEETLAALASEQRLDVDTLQEFGRREPARFLKASNLNQTKVEQALREAEPDVIVFTGGGLIRKNILSIPKQGILNCHAGILPRYRGMDVVEWALLEAKDSRPSIGITCHFMDKGVDTGSILKTQTIEVQVDDLLSSIRKRIEPAMVHLMMSTLIGLEQGAIQPRAQQAREGRQYFVMHPRIKAFTAKKIKAIITDREA